MNKISRSHHHQNTIIQVGDVAIGRDEKMFICGPCSVESEAQIEQVAAFISRLGIKILRGGAYKPRTSPYSFQGLGERGLQLLAEAGKRHNLLTISEVMDAADVEQVSSYVDILQIGARNMQNFALLRRVGKSNKPVLLKRGLMATIEEFLYAAEYILLEGNEQIVLCERGIRTFEPLTRNTLDISCVPLVKQMTHLPIIVDLSHALGRVDIMTPLAKASMACGADGLMMEVHPNPMKALSDGNQSLNFQQLLDLVEQVNPLIEFLRTGGKPPAFKPRWG